MSQSLTAKYRPQRFDEVAGQETVKAVLSRASLEDRVAPAYLFSGTRGVGKTTLARIFAKAVNCVTAPTAEPCNECIHCRQITQGSAVDVIEIDGASNRGIDDARRLREDIGYAPMECRYKVFIIDEAHMLTKEAFNALLKTLEEPPPNVAFVLATTESHKFPATIVSRCQHFVFKRLPAPRLMDHLRAVLEKEGVEYEESALALIAKRAAGSVRDSMSLMGQVIALGSGPLRSEDVRSVLGLAGQEIYFELLEAIHAEDPVGVSRVLGQILDQGLDLGFFLRELVTVWRTLFLLKQSGEAAMPLLDLAEEEATGWMAWAGKLELAHIHAAWQMTLEGQRRVLTSLEPALALELLLVNLAFLPRLVPLEDMPETPSPGGRGAGKQGAPPSGGGQAPGGSRGASSAGQGRAGQTAGPSQSPPSSRHQTPNHSPQTATAREESAQHHHRPEPASAPQPSEAARAGGPGTRQSASPTNVSDPASVAPESPPEHHPEPHVAEPPPGHPAAADVPHRDDWTRVPPEPPPYGTTGESTSAAEGGDAPIFGNPAEADNHSGSGATEIPDGRTVGVRNEYPPGWEGFLERYRDAGGEGGHTALFHARGELDGGVLTIHCKSTFHKEQVEDPQHWRFFAPLVAEHYGPQVRIEAVSEAGEFVHHKELRDAVRSRPLVQGVMEEFDAQFVSCYPVKPSQGPTGDAALDSLDG
jgi:DNA polymerase-3 subunit gamma/tau